MKELDVLLERFVRRAFGHLDTEEIEALERLLDQPDQDILEWIISPEAVPPKGLGGIVALIRTHAPGRS